MELIKVFSLNKVYTSEDIEVRALDGVSISIEEGEFVAIITHDEKIAKMADRVIQLEDGRILQNEVCL